MLHIGMSLLLTMPYERGGHLPPEMMALRGLAFGPHLERILQGMVATTRQVAAFDLAIQTALPSAHSRTHRKTFTYQKLFSFSGLSKSRQEGEC